MRDLDLWHEEWQIWDGYLSDLKSSFIHFYEVEDQLTWRYNENGGSYVPKIGYLYLCMKEDHLDP